MTDTSHVQSKPGFVSRFHVLLLLFTIALGVAGVARATPGEMVPLHWGTTEPDLAVTPAIAFVAMPLVSAAAVLGTWMAGRGMDDWRREAVRHLIDPGLTAFAAVTATVQLGLMMAAIGSEIDLLRIAGFAIAAPLLLLGVLFPEAQRQSYAGLRLPWRIPSDRVWKRAHRAAGLAYGLASLALAATAWLWPDPVTLVPVIFAAMLVPIAVAWAFSAGREKGAA